jgi:hypothetical protein
MVIAVVCTATFAAASQARIQFQETGVGLVDLVGCAGPAAKAAIPQEIMAAVGAAQTGADPTIGLSPYQVNMALPKYVHLQSFNVAIGAPQIAPGDTITAGRVVVAFGTLEELLLI